MGKNAVTILELIIVIILIGILAAIGLPQYTKRIESTRGERAIANIELIVDALKMYYIRNENNPPAADLTNLSDINTTLNLELTDSRFTYEVDPASNYIKATYGDGRYIQYDLDISDGDPDEWNPSDWDWMP